MDTLFANGSVFGVTRADTDRAASLTINPATLLEMRIDPLASMIGLSTNRPETDHIKVDGLAAIAYMVSGYLHGYRI